MYVCTNIKFVNITVKLKYKALKCIWNWILECFEIEFITWILLDKSVENRFGLVFDFVSFYNFKNNSKIFFNVKLIVAFWQKKSIVELREHKYVISEHDLSLDIDRGLTVNHSSKINAYFDRKFQPKSEDDMKFTLFLLHLSSQIKTWPKRRTYTDSFDGKRWTD